MYPYKRTTRWAVLLACLALLAAACGDEGADSEVTEPAPAVTEAAETTAAVETTAPSTSDESMEEPQGADDLALSGPVGLTMWQHSFPPMNEWTLERIAEFTAANPDISVDLEIIPFPEWDRKLLSALATGQAPHFIQGDTFLITLLIDSGAAAPLDPRLFGAADLSDLESQFTDNALTSLIRDGQLFAVPYSVASDVLVYNVALLDEAGIDPAALSTWEAVLEAGEALTVRDGDGNMTQSGFSLIHNNDAYYTRELGTLFYQAGATVTSPDGAVATVNSPQARRVLEFWRDAVHTYGASSPGFTASFLTEEFGEGKIGIAWMSVWANQLLGRKDLVYGQDYGIIPPPSLSPDRDGYVNYGWNWVSNAANNADENLATTMLIDHLSRAGATFFQAAGQFSPRKGWRDEVAAEALAPYAEILDSLDRSQPPAPHPKYNEIWRPVIDAIKEVEANPDADLDALLQRAQEEITATLYR